MSGQKNYVTFETNIMDEPVFSESGDIIIPSGKSVCQYLANSLRSLGIDVSEPKQHEFYGWEFTATLQHSKVWMLLQEIDKWLLIIKISNFGLIPNKNDASTETLKQLNDHLKKLTALENTLWFTREEFELGS